jgi:hypothetical protein
MLANESKILRIKLKGLIIIMFCQKHFSDILEVSFSRGVNRRIWRKPTTYRNYRRNYMTQKIHSDGCVNYFGKSTT